MELLQAIKEGPGLGRSGWHQKKTFNFSRLRKSLDVWTYGKSLGIQSPCLMMIGVSNHLLSKVFRFHYHSQKVIGSLGNVSKYTSSIVNVYILDIQTLPEKVWLDSKSIPIKHRSPQEVFGSLGIYLYIYMTWWQRFRPIFLRSWNLKIIFSKERSERSLHGQYAFFICSIPIGSMGLAYLYLRIYHKNQVNVGKYTIHGSYGIEIVVTICAGT